jgi:hypothetical protein
MRPTGPDRHETIVKMAPAGPSRGHARCQASDFLERGLNDGSHGADAGQGPGHRGRRWRKFHDSRSRTNILHCSRSRRSKRNHSPARSCSPARNRSHNWGRRRRPAHRRTSGSSCYIHSSLEPTAGPLQGLRPRQRCLPRGQQRPTQNRELHSNIALKPVRRSKGRRGRRERVPRHQARISISC